MLVLSCVASAHVYTSMWIAAVYDLYECTGTCKNNAVFLQNKNNAFQANFELIGSCNRKQTEVKASHTSPASNVAFSKISKHRLRVRDKARCTSWSSSPYVAVKLAVRRGKARRTSQSSSSHVAVKLAVRRGQARRTSCYATLIGWE